MELKKLYRKRVNIIFAFLCILPIYSNFAGITAVIYQLFGSSIPSGFEFYMNFFIPQLLLPVGNLIILCFVPKILNLDMDKFILASEKVSILNVLLSIFIMLGIGSVLDIVITSIFNFFESIGISIPSFQDLMPTLPKTPIEIILFCFVIAVLPAISEEIIFRSIVINSLKPLNKVNAILISSLAFAMMHGNLEQIPFALSIGLFFGYLIVKFNSTKLVILLHFINNIISCVFVIIQQNISDDLYTKISNYYFYTVLILGAISVIIFIIINKFKFTDRPSAISFKDATIASLTSVSFWLYMIIYTFLTILLIVFSNLNLI